MNTNRNDKKWLPIFTLFLVVAAIIGFSLYLYRNSHKIAFVRTAELVYGYNGMREAHSAYKAQSSVWQANIDTLRMQYQRCLAEYQTNYKTLSEKERGEKQMLVKKLEENLKNYTSVIREQANEKEKTMTEGVLNQINSYVEEYSKKKGYDFVIGGSNGNLLYGNKAYDITDEVLQAINKEYKIMPGTPAEAGEKQSPGK